MNKIVYVFFYKTLNFSIIKYSADKKINFKHLIKLSISKFYTSHRTFN